MAALVLVVATTGPSLLATEAGSFAAGKKIYLKQCASCHGEDGQGVAKEYADPLYGERSIGSLTRLIERTMPDDDPEACVAEDARLVAGYIYHAFYSLEARHRLGLIPRIEFARLTVAQHQNAIADLVGRFAPKPAVADLLSEVKPGLRARYYQATRKDKTERLDLERIDQRMVFDFGEDAPAGLNYIKVEEPIPENASDEDKKKIEMYRKDGPRYSILWEGAFTANDTGYHEFRITTENGVRLFLNHDYSARPRRFGEQEEGRYEVGPDAREVPIINAWVSSSKGAAHEGRIYLLGGRHYPLRLEFFKSREKTGSLKLEWKAPRGDWAVLDQKYLNTAVAPRTFPVEAPFPADDRSRGYERGSSLSKEWFYATTEAAVKTANEIVERLPLLVHYNKADGKAALGGFMASFAATAFRRPLTADEDRLYRETLFANEKPPEANVRRAVLLVLNSPGFLYPGLDSDDSRLKSYETASKLSFALWDSLPDQALLDAAAGGQLATRNQIEAQVLRMMADPRTNAKLRGFFHHWLEIEGRDLAKDKTLFPGFDDSVIADLRYSLETFIEQQVWSEHSDYRQLLLSDQLLLNGNLRKLYARGTGEVAGDDSAQSDAGEVAFRNIAFPSGERAGLLTHPYLLSAFAYHNNTSPIHRGVFLTRNIVGRSLRPPPDAVAFNDSEFDPNATMREKITQLTRDKSCMNCHSVINPLGFALESYDAIGRWRTSDKEKAVDTQSQYATEDGEILNVASARDIAKIAIASESAPRAFIRQLFYHMLKQSPAAYGADTLEQLRKEFIKNDYNMLKLVARIALIQTNGPSAEPSKLTKL